MSLTVTLPPWLDRLDCAHITFVLTLIDEVDLPALALLQLRREFSWALAELEEQRGADIATSVSNLLFPQPAIDPVIQRQVQKPAAAVIFSPDVVTTGCFAPGHQFMLPALFVGDGVIAIAAFTMLLQLLGQRGIYKGRGRFHVAAGETEIHAGGPNTLSVLTGYLTPNIVPLSWLIVQHSLSSDKAELEVVTPMRLIKKGKPLFRFDFKVFFSALQRRINHLAIAHGEAVIDGDDDLDLYLANILSSDENLHWSDWRRLEQGRKGQGIGGLTGSLTLRGDSLAELWWLLELGSLLHVGKGASYGFGRFRLLQCS